MPLFFFAFIHPKYSQIYRCWVVWGNNIRMIIIPLFLAIAFLGKVQLIQNLNSLTDWLLRHLANE